MLELWQFRKKRLTMWIAFVTTFICVCVSLIFGSLNIHRTPFFTVFLLPLSLNTSISTGHTQYFGAKGLDVCFWTETPLPTVGAYITMVRPNPEVYFLSQLH